ncbi:mage family protein [Phlyctema vagabunda]|uniref:Mage family protein n=1 Tax=Phlyctema vagabunda TaxID=108571 RepID=A0ABR4PHI7_9HELO
MPLISRKRRLAPEDAVESEEEVRNTQRARRPAPQSDNEEDEEEDEHEDGHADAGGDSSSQAQVVKKFVRYALACEYGRVPITRTGIKEKVLSQTRLPYRRIFDATQQQLQEKFGMAMVQLPTREKYLIKDQMKAIQNSSKSKNGAASYVLTSILPTAYRTPTIIPPSNIESPASEATYIGLYTVVISLIALNGGSLADHKLSRYLERMNADQMMGSEKTEFVLKKMERQTYIFKTIDNQGEEQIVEWHVGPRGKMEIGNKGIKGLVTEVYGENAPEDLNKRIHNSLGMEVLSVREVVEGQPEEEEAPAEEQRRSGR